MESAFQELHLRYQVASKNRDYEGMIESLIAAGNLHVKQGIGSFIPYELQHEKHDFSIALRLHESALALAKSHRFRELEVCHCCCFYG